MGRGARGREHGAGSMENGTRSMEHRAWRKEKGKE